MNVFMQSFEDKLKELRSRVRGKDEECNQLIKTGKEDKQTIQGMSCYRYVQIDKRSKQTIQCIRSHLDS